MTNEELKEAAQRYIANFNVNCAASFEIPDGAWLHFVEFVQQLEKNNDRQEKLVKWGTECFGAEHMADRKVRGLRLLEEAIEFCQSVDAPVEQCAKLVEHVYSRPPGDPKQELGGVGVGWFAAAAALGCNALDCLDVEIERVMSKPRSHFTQRNLQKNEAGFTGKPGQTQPITCVMCGSNMRREELGWPKRWIGVAQAQAPTPATPDDSLHALRQWEEDTGAPAKTSEAIAFMDGFNAGREAAKSPAQSAPQPDQARADLFSIEICVLLAERTRGQVVVPKELKHEIARRFLRAASLVTPSGPSCAVCGSTMVAFDAYKSLGTNPDPSKVKEYRCLSCKLTAK